MLRSSGIISVCLCSQIPGATKKFAVCLFSALHISANGKGSTLNLALQKLNVWSPDSKHIVLYPTSFYFGVGEFLKSVEHAISNKLNSKDQIQTHVTWVGSECMCQGGGHLKTTGVVAISVGQFFDFVKNHSSRVFKLLEIKRTSGSSFMKLLQNLRTLGSDSLICL
jgi:hypothetical protein